MCAHCRCSDKQHSVTACLALACDYALDSFFMKCRTFFLDNLDTLSRSDTAGRAALQAQLADGGTAPQLADLLVSVLSTKRILEEQDPRRRSRVY